MYQLGLDVYEAVWESQSKLNRPLLPKRERLQTRLQKNRVLIIKGLRSLPKTR